MSTKRYKPEQVVIVMCELDNAIQRAFWFRESNGVFVHEEEEREGNCRQGNAGVIPQQRLDPRETPWDCRSPG